VTLEQTSPARDLGPRTEVMERTGSRRVPPPLLALLAATLVLGLTWALVNPAFEAPDEQLHFGVVQSIADGPGLPGDAARPPLSSEEVLALDNSNADQASAQLLVKMEWSARAYGRWRTREAALPATALSDGGGPNPAGGNPPLYYLYASAPYLAASGGDLFDRLLAARLGSVLLLLVTVSAAWLLVGEIVDRNRVLQLAGASLAGLAPMMTFVSSSVTPDAALFALWTLALWLGVRVLKRGLAPCAIAGLFAATGAACCVKATSYALIPGALFVLAVGLWRLRPRIAARGAVSIAGAALGIALTLGVWIVVAHGLDRTASAQLGAATTTTASGGGGVNLRMLLSYVWQFYLPRTPLQSDFVFLGNVPPVWDIWIKGAWGRFGWLEVKFPPLVYLILSIATATAIVLAAVRVWRTRRSSDWAVGVFLAVVAGVTLAGLHWSEFLQIRGHMGMLNQGRYLLPLVGIAGVVVAQALRALPVGRRAQGLAVVVGGLLVLQLFSLGLILQRFYA
jgi:4-amino-4-deoxy-L-arabinose transferase-like glycosyltransferase